MATLGNPLVDNPDQRTLDLFRQKLASQAPLTGTPLGAQQEATPAPKPLTGPWQPAPSLATTPQATGPMPLATPATLGQPMTPLQTEHQRLTAPPIQGGPLAHTKADTGRSGLEQIQNPWLRNTMRVLDVIGSGFAPRLTEAIPGTTLHHRGLVNMNEAAQKQEEANANAVANRAHLSAETAELPARAAHETAEAEALTHPKSDKVEAKTVETSDGIRQWNPETQRYDIPVGQAPGKEQQNVHVLPDGSVVAIHHDPKSGKSSAEVVYKGDPSVKTEVKQLEIKGKPHQVLINAATGQTIKDLGETGEKPSTTDRGQNFIDPNTHKLVRVEPGGSVPEGALTAAGVNSQNTPTSATRTMAETAPKVLDLSASARKLIDRQAKSLGPAAGRWSEFMAGKIGAPNPEFTKLRTDIGLLQTALMRMHVGARGGEQMMEHFRNLIDVAKQSPENLKAALDEIDAYAKEVGAGGRQQPSGGNKDTLPGGISLQDIDAEIARRKKK